MRDQQPVVTLSFFRFGRARDRLWALGQMALARHSLARVAGIGNSKLMGAGTGEGFTPVPDTSVVAILATWADTRAAAHGLRAPVFARYRDRSVETFALVLGVTGARGRWGGTVPFAAGSFDEAGPVAALTRASVRPRALLRFWGRVPEISARVGKDSNVLFKAGIGEVPWLHQVTFSIWPDTASMTAFARADGPHAAAIRAVRENGWFSEELYARFRVLRHEGHWGGIDPLAGWAGERAGVEHLPALAAE
jgi:spheroidene monooxygenase